VHGAKGLASLQLYKARRSSELSSPVVVRVCPQLVALLEWGVGYVLHGFEEL
jgi:hypothetical protein